MGALPDFSIVTVPDSESRLPDFGLPGLALPNFGQPQRPPVLPDFGPQPQPTPTLPDFGTPRLPNFSSGLTDAEFLRVLSSAPGANSKLWEAGPLSESTEAESARQIALDQPMAAVDGHGNIVQERPQNNPEANRAEFAKLWQIPTDVTRAALTDAETTALLPVTASLYGAQGVAGMQASLPTAIKNAFRDTSTNLSPEPLPVDVENAQLSQQHPVLATAAKVGQGVAGTAPLLLAGGTPAWVQWLMALGFTGQMIADAGPSARALGNELGKNPEDRDNDVITSAISDLAQDFGFAPFAGLHGVRDVIERYADKPMFVIRKLSDQLQNAPMVSPSAPVQSGISPAATTDETQNAVPGSQGIDDLAAAVKNLQDTLRSKLPEQGQQTVIRPPDQADEIIRNVFPANALDIASADGTQQPAQDTVSPPAAVSNVPGGFRTQTEGLAQKLEGLKADVSENRTYATLFPGLDPTSAKLIWNGAVSVAQNLVRGGGTVADAIETAIRYIRENFKDNFDESGARTALIRSLGSTKHQFLNRLPIEQFETLPYAQFRKFPKDRLAGHELLQNAWLRENGYGRRIFPQNPAMALPQKFHAGFVTPLQSKFGLHYTRNLGKMTAEENILFNAEILRRLNVPHAAIEQAVNASLQYAKTLSKPRR